MCSSIRRAARLLCLVRSIRSVPLDLTAKIEHNGRVTSGLPHPTRTTTQSFRPYTTDANWQRTQTNMTIAQAEDKANVLVLGGGAVGTMAAYALEAGGRAKVTMVLRSNYDAVMKSGFSIDSIDHGQRNGWLPSRIRTTISDPTETDMQHYDFIVVTTKNIPDVPPTVSTLIRPAVTSDLCTIVLMQNGLNIEKPLLEAFPNNTILSGIQMIGASETAPGIVLHNEPDICKLGVFEAEGKGDELRLRDEQRARRFVEAYNACGRVDCRYDDNVRYTRWKKLLYNSSYNPVSAVLGMDVTRMRVYKHVIDDLVAPIMREIAAIAAADGVHLSEDLVMKLITIDKLDSWFMPSMGQDAGKGNFIEFENIVGEPMREAKRLGVPCPTLTTMYSILKGIQTKTKETRGLITPRVTDARPYRG